MHVLPHLFTIGNLFAGYFAISALLRGEYDLAAMAIGVGIALDGLDGATARLVRTASPIGVQLDSLADVVTFGVAPAFLAYAWGVEGLDAAGSEYSAHIRRVGWIASFAYVAACALRLARFNVMTHDEPETPPPAPRHAFSGMPTPTAAACVAVVVHLVKAPLAAWPLSVIWVAGLFVLSGLMISRVPFAKPKRILAGRLSPRLQMLALALLLAAVYYYSEIVLAALLLAYLTAVEIQNLRAPRGRGTSND
ncbi:MAG TPA: phosphatidylcholine/phosphatidylserine synthase [Gemmatimonadota bacterium]|nr:phosphatidylcholine/phosphatidylserine synthase [Gemmatimonadota bacterium]